MTTLKTYWNTGRRTSLGALEDFITNLLCEDKTSWAVATKVYMQSYAILILFGKLGGGAGRGMGPGLSCCLWVCG